jgi:E3 ubiquitin-protein ligase TRIP12
VRTPNISYSQSVDHLLRLAKLWSILGQFVGKALLDSRIIDMSFNALFLKYILNEEVPLTIASLKVSSRWTLDLFAQC